jgi:5-methylcytosine-specific restriction endonuclease McrA
LVRVGYLRETPDALIVIEQERRFEQSVIANNRAAHASQEKRVVCGPPTRRTRARIMKRDKRTCRYCAAFDARTIDHKVPQTKGGTNDDSNLVVACKRCNSRKGARTPEQAGMRLIEHALNNIANEAT